MAGEIELREYEDRSGWAPFAEWFDQLEPVTAARVRVSLTRLANGNVSDVKGVGEGVLERRIHFGPGYRVYFGRDGHRLILLLAGGTKKRQSQDIENAQLRWADYKSRKK